MDFTTVIVEMGADSTYVGICIGAIGNSGKDPILKGVVPGNAIFGMIDARGFTILVGSAFSIGAAFATSTSSVTVFT